MKKIRRVLLVCRPHNTEAIKLAQQVAKWLCEKDIQVYSLPQQKIKNLQALAANQAKIIELAVVIGGDGTYLQTAQWLGKLNTPIFGVNMGSLGFLTTIPAEAIFTNLQMALQNKLELRPRAMLDIECQINKNKKKYRALNDVIIERGDSSQLIRLGIYRNNQFVYALKADGLIISTPTGSTAYNLAAGGPIVYPYSDVNIVTPIAPHSLTSRPIIFPSDAQLSFKVLDKSARKARLNVDGQLVSKVGHNDQIKVKKAKDQHFVLRRSNQNYFDILRQKLQFGQRN